MKVTVAFGDVKVVVPCGNGDITIRQLSELAITRYQKSLQQDTNSTRMSVNINALVLARDCGILDWDDSVSDVVDDRELIIARFQNKPNLCSKSNQKHTVPNSNITNTKSSNNNHYLCSEWTYCSSNPGTTNPSSVPSKTANKVSYNSPAISRGFSEIDSIEAELKMHNAKNGSCLASVSPDSIDSSKHIAENVNADQCCSILSNENTCIQKVGFWNQFNSNKESFSLEESDSSQWPVPPPLIVSTMEDSTPINKCTFSHPSQAKCLSSPNPNDPYFRNKPLEYITKKPHLKNMTKPTFKTNHDIVPVMTSLSPSLPSNADAKSLPQSFYSSLESTAVSDNNNSSYDDTNNEEVTDSSKSISTNQVEDKSHEENLLNFKSKTDVPVALIESAKLDEISSNKVPITDSPDYATEAVQYDLSDIPEEENSSRSQKYASPFPHHGQNTMMPNSSKVSTSLQFQPQMPPPMPPLRSAFTKLSPNPLGVSIKPVNFLQTSDTDLALPPDCLQLMSKASVTQPKSSELSKSEHSIPSLFESNDRIAEDMENEWSLSGKSGDQESMATTTTTETSVNTTTTTTTNSHSTLNKTSEKYVLTVSLKKSPHGFGFSLTSRQNPVDLTNPVYVSKVLENGPAILDGRMKSGDRIVMINEEDVSQSSQKEIKEILLNIPTDSIVKIGLYRPISDAITNLLDAINAASTSQKKSIASQALNHTDEREYNEDCNQICVEDQKPVSFPMCSCIHKNSQPCSKLNLYHFVIPLRPAKGDYLSPQFLECTSPDNISKTTTLRSQNIESKIEPPAIPLNHQNKLSPCSFSSKSQSTSKASNATLGISVRRGISQMSFNDSHIDCHNACHGQSKIYNSSKSPNKDIPESFSPNNYIGNVEDSNHKFCPNCHGLLSLKNGVFVKSIIPGGAAHMDARVLTGDEIIAVQGVCLHNGEDFLLPNNKVLLGDAYDSLKFAQVPSKFQNRHQNMISSTLDPNDKIDPLSLLKQILSHAQSICLSVSLTILRRSLEQRSCSINTLASVDANCCHNVTVAADIHTPYKNDDLKSDNLLSYMLPTAMPSTGHPGVASMHKQRIERFEEYHNKDHNQRYYRDDRDNSLEIHTSDLICLQSDHGSDDPIPAITSENNSIPSPSHTNNASLAESYHVSSGILTDYEKVCVPKMTADIHNDSSVVASSIDHVVSLRHANNYHQLSFSVSDLNPDPNIYQHPGSEFDISYFNRNDSTRKSFSLKRKFIKNTKFSLYGSAELSSAYKDEKKNQIRPSLPRPISSLSLYEVPEEDPSDYFSPDLETHSQFEYSTQTIDRKTTLRRRGGMKK